MTTLDQLRVRTGYSDKGERITRPATRADLDSVLLNEGAEKRELCTKHDQWRCEVANESICPSEPHCPEQSRYFSPSCVVESVIVWKVETL